MKLIDKLAGEYAWAEVGYKDREAIQLAYEAGFLACREMASKLLKESWVSPKYVGYRYEDAFKRIGEDVEKLGEQEL